MEGDEAEPGLVSAGFPPGDDPRQAKKQKALSSCETVG